jgi:hypothetical protein
LILIKHRGCFFFTNLKPTSRARLPRNQKLAEGTKVRKHLTRCDLAQQQVRWESQGREMKDKGGRKVEKRQGKARQRYLGRVVGRRPPVADAVDSRSDAA